MIGNCINLFIGKKCWAVVAGAGTGSIVHLGFGKKKLRARPLTNPHLSKDEQMFDAEIGLMIYCSWRLSKSGKILCGWTDSNESGGDMLKGLSLLRDKQVIDIHIGKIGYDLNIYFDDNICLQLFCDVTDNYDNYIFYIDNAAYTIGLKSRLEAEYYLPLNN